MSYASERIDERRRAVAALTRLATRHANAFRYAQADAMKTAKCDVLYALKQDAAYLIEESVCMIFRDEAEWARVAQPAARPELCA